MIRTHHEDRSLLAWLTTQEKVLRMWIDEALAAAPADGRFIGELERHHDWLAGQIAQLRRQNAA